MSLLDKFLTGWQFRTRTPSLEVGQSASVVITHYDAGEGAAVARVGDSRLVVDGAGADLVDKVAEIEVTEFDDDKHTGRARLVAVVGETSY